MSYFRNTFVKTIKTPLPADVPPPAVVNFLHNHEAVIHLSPLVTGNTETARTPHSVTYAVSEKFPLLPFGYWQQEIHFTTTFKNTLLGIDTTIHAPLGLISDAVLVVAKDDGVGGEGGWALTETVTSSVNVLFKAFVVGTMVPTRQTMHARLIAKLQERQDGSLQTPIGPGGQV